MSDERDERLKKLAALRALNVDPFGQRFDGAQPAGQVVARFAELENKPVTVAGRITALRSFGKAAFLDVRDWTGKVQVHAKKDKLGEAFAVFENAHVGDLVAFGGPLGKTKTGEITIFAETFTFLSKSLRPLPEKWHGVSDPEIRYRQRYLDLISNPEVMQKFLKRTRIVSLMRRFLDDRGYVEVETPMMHSIPGGAAARPFTTHHNALDMDLFMRIALEIPLKKLLVGGIEKVYEIGRVFRNEGVDTHHNPEFTMIELYHAYGDLRTMMELVESCVTHLAKEVSGGLKVPYGERTIDLTPPWPKKDFCELLKEHAGVDPNDLDACRRKLLERKIDAAKMTKPEIQDEVFSEFVQPNLQDACFVVNQPIEMTPLCRERADRPGFADRFEFYAAGFELANAYTELNDPIVQRKRLTQQVAGNLTEDIQEVIALLGDPNSGGTNSSERAVSNLMGMLNELLARLGKSIGHELSFMSAVDDESFQGRLLDQTKAYILTLQQGSAIRATFERIRDRLADPSLRVDEDFLLALEHGMPPAGGIGIGIDRLVMVLTNNPSIREVILFPLMRETGK